MKPNNHSLSLAVKDIHFLIESESINDEKGPCHFCISDPYGNQILFDQHNN